MAFVHFLFVVYSKFWLDPVAQYINKIKNPENDKDVYSQRYVGRYECVDHHKEDTAATSGEVGDDDGDGDGGGDE